MHARLRTISRAILTISLAVGLCGCGTSVNVSAPGQAKGPVMSIGVPADEPGVGWYHDGEYSGLSVEVAKYVAKVLGYGDEQLFFHSQTPATRLDRLDDGSVDFAMVTFAYDGGKNALEMDHTQTADAPGTRSRAHIWSLATNCWFVPMTHVGCRMCSHSMAGPCARSPASIPGNNSMTVTHGSRSCNVPTTANARHHCWWARAMP